MRYPRAPESEYYDQFPLTVNDRDTHDRVRTPFDAFFEDGVVGDGDPVTASEDFSRIPGAWDASYLYWNVTGTVDPSTSDEPLAAHHSPFFAPATQPTLQVMTQAHIVAALAYLDTDQQGSRVGSSTSTHALRCFNRPATPQAWDRTPPIRRRIEPSCLLQQ